MKTLRDMLGRWKYTYGTSDKFYMLEPDPSGTDTYRVAWGKNGRVEQGAVGLIQPVEAMRRILEKERGGYELRQPFSATSGLPIPASADTVTEDTVRNAKRTNIVKSHKPKTENIKPVPDKPVRKGFSLVEWVEN